jgi:GNAT superfamily N-acetyltransferase
VSLGIRAATIADEPAVTALLEALFEPPGARPSMRFGRRVWLEDLVVRPTERGQGIGKRLLDAAADWGQARGCAFLDLTSGAARKDAHRFYRANGMVESSVFDRPIPVRR